MSRQDQPADPALGLVDGFLASAHRHPDRPALEVAGEVLCYADLYSRASGLAGALRAAGPDPGPLTAVLAHRSATAFAGVLAALLRGHGYVPLNPHHPAARLAEMLERSRCHSVVVDRAGEAALPGVLAHLHHPLIVLCADRVDVSDLQAAWPADRFLAAGDLNGVAVDRPRPGADEIAYLLFTSGSTGRPKAVMVSHGNATHFVEMAVRRYRIDPEDRLSQTFDLTFDLSVFDMFVAWTAGACLCCPSEGQKILPATYILGDRLSVWFSVPSIGLSMSRLRMLRPDQYPGLRLVLFCGEALPVEVAEAWQRAAPNAIIENLYGPTELTVACTAYTWRPDASAAESVRGVVPIGEPLPGMQALVVDEHCQEVSPGEDGELLMTGPQLSLGYLEDPVRTMAAFVQPPGRKDVYYRTGDRVRRPAQAGEPMHFLGRFDGQVKVRGHRVEVGEVEAALRERPGVDGAVVLPWPVTAAGADGLVAFVSGRVLDPDDLERSVRERLPTYMHPSAVHVLSEFPLNQNGKVDRRALASRLGDA